MSPVFSSCAGHVEMLFANKQISFQRWNKKIMHSIMLSCHRLENGIVVVSQKISNHLIVSPPSIMFSCFQHHGILQIYIKQTLFILIVCSFLSIAYTNSVFKKVLSKLIKKQKKHFFLGYISSVLTARQEKRPEAWLIDLSLKAYKTNPRILFIGLKYALAPTKNTIPLDDGRRLQVSSCAWPIVGWPPPSFYH